MKRLVLCSAFLLFTVGCAHKTVTPPPELANVSNEKDGITARMSWLKNKSNSVDVSISFENGYSEDAVIKASAWTLQFEGQKVGASYGVGDIQLNKGMNYDRVLIFPLLKTDRRQGQVTITADPITLQPSGKTVKPLKFVLPLGP